MAGKSMSFSVAIKLISDQFTKGIKNIERQIKGLGGFIKGAFALGTITAFGRQMISVSSEFEDAMARVQAVSNAVGEDFKMMSNEARKLGATTKFTATEAANALENLTRNGLTAQQATRALSGVLQLAQANAIGLAEAATITTNTMNMFGLTSRDTAHINDVLSSTAANSATNISQLYEALVNAAPSAHTLNINLEETAAALGAMAQRGYKGAEAGTQLRMALTKMVDPKIVKKMQDMGVAIDEQVIKENGLLDVVSRLRDAHLDLGELVGIFSQRGAQGMAQLINSYNDFERLLLVIRDSQGTTARMFQQGIGSTKNSLLMLKSAYQEFLITIGERSRGPFNTIVKYLTDVVKNCKSLGGIIANIASVVIPLFISKFVTAMTTFKAKMVEGIGLANALKAAMGGWISIIASLAAWIGTNLVLSATRANREIKNLNKQLEETGKDSVRLKGQVDSLVQKLGTEYDKDTLNGVVLQACRLFPDMREAILEAARAADDTHSYDKLKSVLSEILELQSAVGANAVLQDLAKSYTEKLADKLKSGARGIGTAYEKEVYKAIKENVGKGNRSQMDAIYYTIADRIGRAGTLDEAFEAVKSDFKALGIEVSDEALKSVVRIGYITKEAEKLAEVYDKQADNFKVIDKHEQEQAEAAARLAQEQQNQAEAEERARAAADKKADDEKKRVKIQEDLDKAISDAEDDLVNGFIDLGQKLDLIAKAYGKAYEDLRDLEGKKGSDNEYFEGRKEAESAANTYKERQKTGEELKKALEISSTNKIKQSDGKIPGGKQDIEFNPVVDEDAIARVITIGSIRQIGESLSESIQSANGFANALENIEDAFNKLGDANASWIEKLQATFRIIDETSEAIKSLSNMFSILGDEEMRNAIKCLVAAKLKRKEDAKDVAANSAKAISGAASSVADIPIAGPILAVAAAAGIVALLAATLPKFAAGGVVGGGSRYGDKMLARVNSGEMILNNHQQKRLFDIANGKAAPGGGELRAVIKGKDLELVLRNNNTAYSKISSKL